MNKILNIERILVFNDFVDLFIAKDKLDLSYLCLLTKNTSEGYQYYCVGISKKRLYQFINGKIDLRQVFEDPEIHEYYSTEDTSNTEFIAYKANIEVLAEELLPSDGYYYTNEIQDEMIRREVMEYNNVVIHLSLSDDSGESSIPIKDLGDFSNRYQSLVEYSYKKAISILQIPANQQHLNSENFTLRAFGSSPGSFNLHLKSNAYMDLFGNSIIVEGLKLIDNIISIGSSTEELIEKFKSVKGHTLSQFKNLIDKILEKNVDFKYKWLSPSSTEIITRTITEQYATNVKEILALKDELIGEDKEFIGYVKQADVERGTWRITNESDGKDYPGESAVHLLDGVTLETVKYKFICDEIIETLRVTEKEKIKYILKDVQKLS